MDRRVQLTKQWKRVIVSDYNENPSVGTKDSKKKGTAQCITGQLTETETRIIMKEYEDTKRYEEWSCV